MNKRMIKYIGLFLLGFIIFFIPRTIRKNYRVDNGKRLSLYRSNISRDLDMEDELYNRLKIENNNIYINGYDKDNLWAFEDVDINLLDYKEDIIGIVYIDKIDVRLPIFLGASKDNMRKGAVHLTSTSYPIGGVNTNSIIAAHRGTIRDDMFKYVDRLEEGDRIRIANLWTNLDYRVVDIKVVEDDDLDSIAIIEGRDLLTLLSCHPYPTNQDRILIICERVM